MLLAWGELFHVERATLARDPASARVSTHTHTETHTHNIAPMIQPADAAGLGLGPFRVGHFCTGSCIGQTHAHTTAPGPMIQPADAAGLGLGPTTAPVHLERATFARDPALARASTHAYTIAPGPVIQPADAAGLNLAPTTLACSWSCPGSPPAYTCVRRKK